jgi:adenosylcobinamide kinase/adenosylcobinamide-phosphate guanylyltransferase
MGKLIFVTGGARSGKSRFAEDLFKAVDDVLYAATAFPFDDEMENRIRIHKERRNPLWETVEGYNTLAENISQYRGSCSSLLFECVTIMVTNLMLEDRDLDWDIITPGEVGLIEQRVDSEVDALIAAAKKFSGIAVIVSNETGMGIIPASPLSRHFSDIAGRANQKLAASADEVYFTVSGIPVKIKGEK